MRIRDTITTGTMIPTRFRLESSEDWISFIEGEGEYTRSEEVELVVGFSSLGEITIEEINIVSRIDDNEDFGIIFSVVMVTVDVVVETAVVCDELLTVIVEDGTTNKMK